MDLVTESLSLGYGSRRVIETISLSIKGGEMVAVVGPNGSGKSTLLRGMARVQRPSQGRVLLGGRDIRGMNSREVGRTLAFLPQAPDAGLDLTVRELVWRGRYPHQGILQRATAPDYEAVGWAMESADVAIFADRPLGSLSGGERQRAWIAMALAQQPQVLLLDEPTSFLDLAHQVEILNLLRRLNGGGMTVVAVLHDLLLASRYCGRVIGVCDGRVAFDGTPEEVLQPAVLEPVFGIEMLVIADPATGRPLPLPGRAGLGLFGVPSS